MKWPYKLQSRGVVVASTLLATLLGSFAFWDPLVIDDRAQVARLTLQSAGSVRSALRAEMATLFLFQTAFAKSLATRGALVGEQPKLESRRFLDGHPAHLRIQWVDTRHRVRWSVDRGDERQRDAADLVAGPELTRALDAASDRRVADVALSRAFRLPSGNTATHVVVPLWNGDALDGFLVTLLDTNAALNAIVANHRWPGYSVAVLDDGLEVFRTPGSTSEHEQAWARETELQLAGTIWRVRVWPEAEALADVRSALPEVALILGGLLGFALMRTVHFARAAQSRAEQLREAHDDLEQRVRERTLELRNTNESLQGEVAERVRAEQLLRSLSGRLLQLQDEERRRIARELHDSTAQTLGAVAINVDKAQQMAQGCADRQLGIVLRESAAFLDQAVLEIRTLSYLLHPPMLDDLGLEYVLAWYARGFSSRSGIDVRVNVEPALGRLPRDVELTVFRIVQEALTNVHRHSGSRTASVALCCDGDTVVLEITDQGRGIPAHVLTPTPGTTAELGVGITGMRERVRQLGGQIAIVSDATRTTVRTVLPLPAATNIVAAQTDWAHANCDAPE
jgi:signal transduction histidine kinase